MIMNMIGKGPDGKPGVFSVDKDGRGIFTFSPDLAEDANVSVQVTLNATPATVTVVNIPVWASGVRIRATGAPVRFALNEDPAPIGTSNAATVTIGMFTVGGIAYADETETRLIASGTNRTLRLISTSASTVVTIELF